LVDDALFLLDMVGRRSLVIDYCREGIDDGGVELCAGATTQLVERHGGVARGAISATGGTRKPATHVS